MEEIVFADVPERRRFELQERGMTAFANYRRENGRLVIPHVESPPPLRGKGTADRLMRAIASYARERQLTTRSAVRICASMVPASPGLCRRLILNTHHLAA